MRRPVYALVFGVVFVLAGCASAQGGAGSDVHGTAVMRDPSVITQKELDRFPSANAYDIIWRLHPQWLTARGQTTIRFGATPPAVMVYMGSSQLGGTDELRSFTGAQLASIRHLDAARATLEYGSGNMSGAIVLKRR